MLTGGEMGGVALADVLFGRYNPSGKLAATMYPPNYVNQIPLTEMGLTVPPGRTHMFYTGKPSLCAAHWLSIAHASVQCTGCLLHPFIVHHGVAL